MSDVVHRIDGIEAGEVKFALEFPRTIARETKYDARVLRVALSSEGRIGRGESAPMAHYGDSIPAALAQIEAVRPTLAAGISREGLMALLPPGGARNALDSALWDLEAQATGTDAAAMAGLDPLRPVLTAYTIPIDTVEAVTALALRERHRPLIKVKLGHIDTDRARLEAIRAAAPDATLVVDANEGWSLAQLEAMAPVCRDAGVALIEQPIKAGEDHGLMCRDFGIPLCADESCHTRASLDSVMGRYAYVNIKLDKTGGPTEALALAVAAKARGLGVMIGCTEGSTLGIAPAYLVAHYCDFCDLDAPLHLAGRETGELAYDGSMLSWSTTRRWGVAA